jgi:hypothetical protein
VEVKVKIWSSLVEAFKLLRFNFEARMKEHLADADDAPDLLARVKRL